MIDKLEKYRAELREIAAESKAAEAEAKARLARRTETVARARRAGMTWREASVILGMSEHGLIKAATPSTTKSVQKPIHKPTIDEISRDGEAFR